MFFHEMSGPGLGPFFHQWLLATVLAVAAGIQIGNGGEGSSSDAHSSVVRREARAEEDSYSVSIDSAAALRRGAHHSDVFISAEAKARLGLSPDADAPRRDALLQERAAVLRRQLGNSSSAVREADPFALIDMNNGHQAPVGMPPSLLQEAAVTSHTRRETRDQHRLEPQVIAPAPSPRHHDEKVPDWRKYALSEDGSPDVQLLIPTSQTREKAPPDWVHAGLAQEDLLTNFDKEMARLGVTGDQEHVRAALEDHLANPTASTWDLAPDPAEAKGEGSITEGGAWGPTPKPIPVWADPMAFRFYRFTPLKLREVSKADSVSVADFHIWTYGQKLELNKVSVAFNEMARNPPNEDAMKAVDGNVATKWTDMHMGSLMIILPWNVAATNFAFNTGPDHSERDPVQWYWEGSKDLKHWTMLMGQLSDAGSVSTNRGFMTDQFAWKVDCLVSDWHEWSACNQNCSGGNQTRVRSIQRHSWNDGECMPVGGFFQVQHCNEEPCEKGVTVKAGAQRGGYFGGIVLWVLLAVAGSRAV